MRVVAGLLRIVPPGVGQPLKLRYNEARIYTPGGAGRTLRQAAHAATIGVQSDARHRPDSAHGARHGARWGVAICEDMDFTQLGRRYGATGAGLMLVPGWDFDLD